MTRWIVSVLFMSAGCVPAVVTPVTGVVRDENGQPLQDVTVTIGEKVLSLNVVPASYSTSTDADGRFQFKTLDGTAFKVGRGYSLELRRNSFESLPPSEFVYPPKVEFNYVLKDLVQAPKGEVDENNGKNSSSGKLTNTSP